MLSSIVAGLVLLQAQDPVKDYKLPVMSVGEFGKWFGEQSGELVIVSPEVEDRDIYINVKQRRLDELVRFVETAAGLKILHENGAITFLPGRSDSEEIGFQFWEKNVSRLAEENIDTEKLTNGLKELKETLRLASQPNPPSDVYRKLQDGKGIDPAMAVLEETVRALGQEGFRSIPDNYRVVFSTKPTRLQRAWPSRADQQMRWLNDIADTKNRLVREIIPKSDEMMEMWSAPMIQEYGGVKNPIKDMMLVVRRTSIYYSVQLRLFDGKGVATYSIETFIGGMSDPDARGINYNELFADLEGEYRYSDEEKEEARRVRLLSNSDDNSQLFTKSDLEFLANLDQAHPFAGLISRILDYGCEVTGNEVVKEVTGLNLWFGEADKISASGAARLLWLGNQDKEVRNSLVVNEPDPMNIFARTRALPRRVLAPLARKILSKGTLDIDTLADSILQLNDRKRVARLVQVALALSGQDASDGYYSQEQWDMFALEIYARLNRMQRQETRSERGLTLVLGQVSTPIQALFNDQLLKAEIETSSMAEEYEFDESEMQDQSIIYGSWKREQTVFLTEQSSWPARMTLKLDSLDGILSNYQYDGFSRREMADISGIGAALFWEDWNKQNGEGSGSSYTVSYSESSVTNLNLQLDFGEISGGMHVFSLLNSPVTSFVSFDKLPKELREKILAEKEKTKKEFGEHIGFGGHGGGSVPPP